MTKITMSGCLQMRIGHAEWIERYVTIAGLTIAWFSKKREVQHKAPPLGVISLINCRLKPSRMKKTCSFTVIKQQNDSHKTLYMFEARTHKLRHQWVKSLKQALKECKTIQTSSMNEKQRHAFGVYKNAKSFEKGMKDGDIVLKVHQRIERKIKKRIKPEPSPTPPAFVKRVSPPDVRSSASMESCTTFVSNADPDLPKFYTKLTKKRHSLGNTLPESEEISYLRSGLDVTDGNKSDASEKDSPSSEAVALLRTSAATKFNIGLDRVSFKDEDLKISERNVIRQGHLFYSCGNTSKAVFVQLCQNKIYQFEDEECIDEVAKIDFRSITSARKIDHDTFELHTVIHDKVHVFAMYDTHCHDADLWINDMQELCNVTKMDRSDDAFDRTPCTEEEDKDNNMAGERPSDDQDTEAEHNKHQLSWYHYLLCFCCCRKTQTLVKPDDAAVV